MNATTAAAVLKIAASDCRRARREGFILVCGTKAGTVAVTFEAGTYAITTQGMNAREIVKGTKREAEAALALLYTIEIV